MPLYDYIDGLGHTTEAIRASDVTGIPCPVCGRMARRSVVNHGIGIVGPTTDTRGMFRRFQEASAEIDHAASTIEATTGQPVQTPNLWQAAKHRATAMNAAGENPYPPTNGA